MSKLSKSEIELLQTELEDASPQDILRHAVETFGRKTVIVTSFQVTGIVTLHMLQDIAPDIRVYTLDTGLLFPETYALIDELETRWSLNLIRVKPKQTVTEQAATHGDALWERNPNQCCNLRKVVPLKSALRDVDAWFTGIRRDQSPTRVNTPVIQWDERNKRVKYAPFAQWTEDMIWTYIHAYELPYNALYNQGYPSIGCFPCTQAVAPGDDIRAGRWANQSKTECGIHFGEDEAK